MAKPRNIFDEVREEIRAELKSFRKDADRSTTPKVGQSITRAQMIHEDPIARQLAGLGITREDVRRIARL